MGQIAKCSEGQVQWGSRLTDECLEGARVVGVGGSRGDVGDEAVVGGQARDNDESL